MKKIFQYLLLFMIFVIFPISVKAVSWNYGGTVISGSFSSDTNVTANYKLDIPSGAFVNHLKGKIVLNQVEIVSYEFLNGFEGTLNKTTGEYNVVSEEEYTNVTNLVFLRITFRHVSNYDVNKPCNANISPEQTNKVNLNNFSITKEAYKNGTKISSIKEDDEFEYKITVKGIDNYRETDNVIVTDYVPNDLEIIDDGGAVSSNPYRWELGKFQAGNETKTITIKVRLKETFKSSILNEATLTAGGNEFSADNELEVQYSELSITKKTNKDEVTAGSIFQYQIIVKNSGNGTSNDVLITDELDSNLEVISISGNSYTKNNNTYSFDLGSIKAGETKTITIYVRVSATIRDDITEISNTAVLKEEGKNPLDVTVTVEVLSTPDPEQPNNPDEPDLKPDVSITKSVNQKEVALGKEVIYTIVIKNNNSLYLKDVLVSDILDKRLEITEIEIDGNYSAYYGEDELSCIFDLDANEEKTIIIKAKVKEESEISTVSNKASIIYDNYTKDSNEVTFLIVEIVGPKTGIIGYGFIIILGIGAVLLSKKKLSNKLFKI